MPRTTTQVDVLLDQLKAARDAMDTSADTTAAREQAQAIALTNSAATDAQDIRPLRITTAGRDAKDVAGRLDDEDAIRALVNSSSLKKRQAAKLVLNAGRKLSLKHDKERTKDAEICVHCVAIMDDSGNIIGATHSRLAIEDFQIVQADGTRKVAKGLRSLLRDDEADIDPADGRLWVNGKRVGK